MQKLVGFRFGDQEHHFGSSYSIDHARVNTRLFLCGMGPDQVFSPSHQQHHLNYFAMSYSQMSQIPNYQPTAKSPSLFPEWLRGLIQRRKIDAAGQESAIITLASRSLCTFPLGTSSKVVLQSGAANASHGHLAPPPGTEFAVDSNKTFGRRARDYTSVVGAALMPLAEAIPVAGTPLKAAIGTLLGILNVIDVSVKCLRRRPTHIGHVENIAK